MAAIRQWRVRLFKDGEHVRDCFPRWPGARLIVWRTFRFGEPQSEDVYDYVSWDPHAGIMNAEFKETRMVGA